MRAVEEKRLRSQLEQKRRDVFESYRRTQAANRESGEEGLLDLADRATESYRKEFLYSLTDNERNLLRREDRLAEAQGNPLGAPLHRLPGERGGCWERLEWRLL